MMILNGLGDVIAGTCSSPACSGTSVCTVFAGSGIMSGNFSGDVYFLCKIYT